MNVRCLIALAALCFSSPSLGARIWHEASGLRVIGIPGSDLARLHVHVLVKAGACLEDPRRPGAARVVAATIARGGTKSLSASEVAAARERLGLDLRTWVDREFFHLSASMPPSNLYAGSRLLADILFNPAFGGEDALDVEGPPRGPDPRDALAAFFFLDPVFGRPLLRPPAGVRSRVDGEELQAFHRRLFVPANMVMAFSGPVDAERVLGEIRASLFGFSGGSDVRLPSPRCRAGAVVTLALHETSPGKVTVIGAVLGPDPQAEGWASWIDSAFASADAVAAALGAEGMAVPPSPWIRAGYFAAGRSLFEARVEVDAGMAETAAAVIGRALPQALASSGRATDLNGASTGDYGVLDVRDMLMRYCIDESLGYGATISEQWVLAAAQADARHWRAVLRPE